MEMVDVVDENLKVLNSVEKQKAHDQGLLHATVIAEIINSKGEWLLVKQAGHKQDPGQFVSPVGGHVGSGEKYEVALKREAMEEVGLKNFIFKSVGKKIYKRQWPKGIENHYFIVYEINSDEEPTLNDESVEFKRFKVSEIKNLLKSNPDYFGLAFHFVVKSFYSSLFLD
ncbi:MAG: Isopentenyl-diphosphate Delta-isomerase [Candidatus Roizmanbacteria bacterium GW2011_GWA2_35_19]|uniref:Isopentenyl-diphosphate Delta-isomerase n=2 Tax=Candidatus Roizmaniibacteriota TaxID=1752723 RepID=A0A0G0CED8_9BACT|nr:MAG: Isopentenyl-diphosphate Delta-isomerase [Candidatus Roizmanbacteria bacterium GW2011_GWC2_35_12]KKP74441.1 MAG: Isopentenyl-diphosphate Delta-isomerase [Candidatus Roizmanbacteria bacterium GW2011_GWA2_35_19]